MPKKTDMKITMPSSATTVEPWVIDQLGKRPKEALVRDQLQGFYNKEMLDLKLESMQKEFSNRLQALESDADDTQRVVIEQRGKWSKIPKRHEVDDLKTAVIGWSMWFRRVIVGVILFLVGTGGMAVWNYASLDAQVAVLVVGMEKVSQQNETLQQSLLTLEKQVGLLRDVMRYPQMSKGQGADLVVD